MANCYECLHYEACSDVGDAGFSYLKDGEEKCDHFKNKADFAEVKNGEWTRVDVMGNGYGQIYYQHKDCGISSTELYRCPYEYCPRCGAKMDGGRKNDGKG